MIGIEAYCYDDLLFGGPDDLGTRLFFPVSANAENEKAALELIRYSVRYYLGWTPEEACEKLTEDTLLRLGIAEEIKGRIAYPPEAEEDAGARRQYLLSRLYPENAAYDAVTFTEACYAKEAAAGRLPEGFFDGPDGRRRAGICLLYALRSDGYESTEQMFRLMGSSSAGRWLREKRMKRFCDAHFSTPADFLKNALPEGGETKRLLKEAKERIRKRREGALRRYENIGFSGERPG